MSKSRAPTPSAHCCTDRCSSRGCNIVPVCDVVCLLYGMRAMSALQWDGKSGCSSRLWLDGVFDAVSMPFIIRNLPTAAHRSSLKHGPAVQITQSGDSPLPSGFEIVFGSYEYPI